MNTLNTDPLAHHSVFTPLQFEAHRAAVAAIIAEYGANPTEYPATTGVYQTNGLDMHDTLDNGIDPDWESLTRKEAKEFQDSEWEQNSSLIGFREIPKNKRKGTERWEEDLDSDFSAIEDRSQFYTLQITRSHYYMLAFACSPCFPGQGDGDTPAGKKSSILIFACPPEFLTDEEIIPLVVHESEIQA